MSALRCVVKAEALTVTKRIKSKFQKVNLKSDDENTSRDRIGSVMFTDAGIQHLLIELAEMAVVVWPCKGNGLNKHLMKDIRIVLKEGVVWDEEHDSSAVLEDITKRAERWQREREREKGKMEEFGDCLLIDPHKCEILLIEVVHMHAHV